MGIIVFVLTIGGIIYGLSKLSRKKGIVSVIFTLATVFAMIMKGGKDIEKIASFIIDICSGKYNHAGVAWIVVVAIIGFIITVTIIIRKMGYDWKTSISIGGISYLVLAVIIGIVSSIINYLKTIL